MKKIVVFVFSTLFIFLAACGNSSAADYDEALSYMDSGDYTSAADCFEALGDYEDAASKLTECYYYMGIDFFNNADYDSAIEYFQLAEDYNDSAEWLSDSQREKGMTENADYDFLNAIEESILWRMDQSDTTERSVLVSTELAMLEQFEELEFYDSELKAIATTYIEGLYTQQDAFSYNYYSEYQVEWQEGLVARYSALNRLYEEYGFLNDNAEFIGTYISQLEYESRLLDAYNALVEDISVQFDEAEADLYKYWEYDLYSLTGTFTNNTEYTFTTIFEFKFYDEDGVLFGDGTDIVENIKPGQSYTVSVYVPDDVDTLSFDWECYYGTISW